LNLVSSIIFHFLYLVSSGLCKALYQSPFIQRSRWAPYHRYSGAASSSVPRFSADLQPTHWLLASVPHPLSVSLSLSLSLSHSHSLSACVCIEYRLLASVPLPLDLYLLLLGTRSFLKCLSDSFSVLHIPILILIIGFFPPLEVMQTWFLLYFLVLDFTVLSMTTFGAASAPNPNPNKSFEVQIVIWGFCFNFLCFFFDSWA
jgi:hypothetical protein